MMTRRNTGLSAILALGLVWGASRTIAANGQEFFPADQGPVDLVYFGLIKDAATGRPVKDHAYITIRDNITGMNVPFTGDRPGHFRSPDIGLVIKELGEAADPSQLEFTLVVPGYKKFHLEKMPRRATGAVEVTVKLQPDDGKAPVASASTAPPAETVTLEGAPPPAPQPVSADRGTSTYNIAMIVFVAALLVSAIVAVGRTSSPRASTGH